MLKPYYEANGVTIFNGDCREIMPQLEPVHAIITDPPYGLEFMGKEWDAPWKTDRRQNFDGTLQDQRENPYGRSKVRNGNGASYGADARVMQALQDWYLSWAFEALRVLLPGGYMLSFGGSRTYHRMACAIEDAGFEIRDQIMWLYGSGFPKSLDVAKAIDRAAGAEREVVEHRTDGPSSWMLSQKIEHRAAGGTGIGYADGSGKEYDVTAPATDAAKQFEGWGTALKPAHEPICVARKPLVGTVAANVLEYGTGALNIDGCRVEGPMDGVWGSSNKTVNPERTFVGSPGAPEYRTEPNPAGRWPANVIHDGSDEVVSLFPDANGQQGDLVGHNKDRQSPNGCFGKMAPATDHVARLDSGSAARFFYTAKADKEERERNISKGVLSQQDPSRKLGNPGGDNPRNRGVHERLNHHPTVKPLDLMRYLCKLLCPPSGGILLDPFMGSGSTIIAGRNFYQQCIGIELEEKYCEIAAKRLSQEVFQF